MGELAERCEVVKKQSTSGVYVDTLEPMVIMTACLAKNTAAKAPDQALSA